MGKPVRSVLIAPALGSPFSVFGDGYRFEADVPGSARRTGRRVDLQATFYPKPNFGVIAGIATGSGDAASIDRDVRFGAKLFVSRDISLFFEFDQTDYKDSAESADRTSLGAAMRF